MAERRSSLSVLNSPDKLTPPASNPSERKITILGTIDFREKKNSKSFSGGWERRVVIHDEIDRKFNCRSMDCEICIYRKMSKIAGQVKIG